MKLDQVMRFNEMSSKFKRRVFELLCEEKISVPMRNYLRFFEVLLKMHGTNVSCTSVFVIETTATIKCNKEHRAKLLDRERNTVRQTYIARATSNQRIRSPEDVPAANKRCSWTKNHPVNRLKAINFHRQNIHGGSNQHH